MRTRVILALGATLMASAASAQSYETVTPPSGNTEVVTVAAPTLHRHAGPAGVPIVDVSLSRKARVHALDLWTVYGPREQRAGKRAVAVHSAATGTSPFVTGG